jgi:ferrous iron transport protein B
MSQQPPKQAQPTIALVGRQNAGKTSLLMHLSGTLRKPVNFPGSSVERDEAAMHHGGSTFRLVDLPGLIALDPISPDENVTVAWLDAPDTRPDVLCAVLDATRLVLELPFLAELARLERPIVVALTRLDLADHTLDTAALGAALGVPVVAVNAHSPASPRDFDPLRDALAAASSQQQASSPCVPIDRKALEALVAEVSRALPSPRPSRQRLSDAIDRVVLHRFLGLPLFLGLVFVLFQVLFHGSDPLMTLIEDGQGALSEAVSGLFGDPVPGPFESFLVDGLIGGLGAAFVFIPQIAILIFLVALLETSGFMARAAILLDRPLSKVGLSGRSFVPLASSFACAVPGILATRTIENERERIATIVVAPFMSCSARLPVYVLLIGAFFPSAWAGLVLLALYALGIILAVIVAALVRRTALRGPRALLMLELPVYQAPAWRVVGAQVLSACRAFLVLAGTVILTASVIVWALSYWPRPVTITAPWTEARTALETRIAAAPDDDTRAMLETERDTLDLAVRAELLENSALASIGKAIAPVFEPAGFDWRTTVGILAAFPARELIIPTLGILYRVPDVDAGAYDRDELATATTTKDGLRERLREARRDDGTPAWSPLMALALMVFFALCSQCVATLGAIRRETRSWKWPLLVFGGMTALAWVAAVLVFQLGRAFVA